MNRDCGWFEMKKIHEKLNSLVLPVAQSGSIEDGIDSFALFIMQNFDKEELPDNPIELIERIRFVWMNTVEIYR